MKLALPITATRGQGIDPTAFMRDEPYTQFQTWLGDVAGMEGCPIDCKYCFFQLDGKTPAAPQASLSPHDLVKALSKQLTYIPKMPVNFGSQTDIFSTQRTTDYYREVLALYEASSYTNPIVLITKKRIPDDFLEQVAHSRKTTVFFLSYSGLAGSAIEPNVSPEDQEENFFRASKRGVKCVHYWRPFLPQNASPDVLHQVLSIVSPHALCSVVNGLRLNSGIRENVLPFWPELAQIGNDFAQIGEVWPSGTREALHSLSTTAFPSYPVFFGNTPCALAYAIGQSNPQGLYGGKMCHMSNCPEGQRQSCFHSLRVPDMQDITRACAAVQLDPSSCEITNACVYVRAKVSLAQITFLKTALQFPVTHADRLSYEGGHNWAYIQDDNISEIPWIPFSPSSHAHTS